MTCCGLTSTLRKLADIIVQFIDLGLRGLEIFLELTELTAFSIELIYLFPLLLQESLRVQERLLHLFLTAKLELLTILAFDDDVILLRCRLTLVLNSPGELTGCRITYSTGFLRLNELPRLLSIHPVDVCGGNWSRFLSRLSLRSLLCRSSGYVLIHRLRLRKNFFRHKRHPYVVFKIAMHLQSFLQVQFVLVVTTIQLRRFHPFTSGPSGFARAMANLPVGGAAPGCPGFAVKLARGFTFGAGGC